MRIGLLAVAALLLPAPLAYSQEPPLPPVVFQTQPVGRVLGDLRAGADILGGEKGVKAFNEALKEVFGDKGIEGLDVSRPVVGYVVLAPKPADITAVVMLPVTTEQEFLDLCERANRQKPKLAGKEKDVYELPPLDPRYKALMRFSNRYAYIAYGANPAPHLDPKALVPMGKLYDPAETGLVAARLHFDRIPEPVKKAVPALLEEVKKTLFTGPGIGRQEQLILKPVTDSIEKLAARYIKLAEGADVMAARITFDPTTASVVAEATLKGKPGSELAKTIAAFKPTQNKFGALLNHPDTVAGFKFRVPLFEEEIRTAASAGLDAAQKEMMKGVPDAGKAALEELFQGLIRTVKTGEFDIVAAVRGPDKNDYYTAVGAVAFEDPSKLEKAFKEFVTKQAPPEVADGIKWDAAKAGTVSIHTWKLPAGGGFFSDITKVFGGENNSVAFAFAPHGVFAAIGPDAVGTLKDSLAVKPAASPVLDVLVNPGRTVKLFGKINPNDNTAERILGTDDKLKSALSLTLTGGAELKAALTVDLKILPRAMMYTVIERSTRDKPDAPDPIKK